MYHLTVERRQSLVYFGEPQGLAIQRIDTLGIRDNKYGLGAYMHLC